jgi:hypothetical protein
MLKPACAADARASLQTSLLLTCKSASEAEAAVICSAFAAVKGEFKARAPDCFELHSVFWSETLLVTAAVLVDAANTYDTGSCHVQFGIIFVLCRPTDQIS